MSSSTRTAYSLQELREANCPEYTRGDPDLDEFFKQIHRNKFLHGYLNPYNYHLCPPGQRKGLFPKANAFSDEKLVEDLKGILSKVTEKNLATVKEKVARIPFTPSSWELIIPMLHQVTVDCVFLIESLLDVLEVLHKSYENLWVEYKELLWQQFTDPREFEDNDLSLENAEDRHKRWILSNCEIIAHLFRRNHYSSEWFVTEVLESLVTEITPENSLGIDIIIHIWELFSKKIPYDNMDKVINRLDEISQDDHFPQRQRFLLLDLLENF